jgi:hypothetical protein
VLAFQPSSYPPEWMDDQRVKCKGLTSFFYPNQPSSEVTQAKGVCNGLDGHPPCPLRHTCLRHAIDNHEAYGVWGGTSERERRKIWRARNRYANLRIYSLEDVRFPTVTFVKIQSVVVVRRRQRLRSVK